MLRRGDESSVIGGVPISVARSALPTGNRNDERRKWQRRLTRNLALSDAAIILACVALGVGAEAWVSGPVLEELWIIPFLATVWFLLIGAIRSRDLSCLGSGAVEYRRVANATGLAFGIVAFSVLMAPASGSRTTLALSLMVGTPALLMSRWAWRRWLRRQRLAGAYSSRTLVVGGREEVAYVIGTLDRCGENGFQVVAATLFDDRSTSITVGESTFPAFGTARSVAREAKRVGAETIMVASRPEGAPSYVRELSWELEGTAIELVLSNRVTDVVGPRLSLHPIDGLPLLHIGIPSYEGGHHLLKRSLDLAAGACGLVVLALVTPIVAVLIKLDSPGSVFFSQERVGRNGRTFKMLKFRTMVADAEQRLALLQDQNEGAGPLFKMKVDPRVTRVGAILRKFSIDEFPQFWNVMRGDMSIVGPRPPLPSEVTAYDGAVVRRLYVKPGITGPWQVSGRSDLSWNESVRLDLSYVENWSIMNDLQIMYRTARVMLDQRGAY